MSKVYRTFTSESVTQGHPDKVADIISDAILDAYMANDKNSHVACETCVTTDFCMVFGEITSNTDFQILIYPKTILKRLLEILLLKSVMIILIWNLTVTVVMLQTGSMHSPRISTRELTGEMKKPEQAIKV